MLFWFVVFVCIFAKFLDIPFWVKDYREKKCRRLIKKVLLKKRVLTEKEYRYLSKYSYWYDYWIFLLDHLEYGGFVLYNDSTYASYRKAYEYTNSPLFKAMNEV